MTAISHEDGLPYMSGQVLSQYSHTSDPVPMTAEQMLEAWMRLLADGHSVTFEDSEAGQYCCITVYPDDRLAVDYERVDADPLRAFEQAFRAYREAQEQRR